MNSKHLLVAEDDKHIREGLVDALTSEGYEVTAVANGSAVLTAFREAAYQLVILDIMMPGRSGYDVCRDLRKINEQIPIMMLTAKSEEIDKVIGLELGADDYMTKPFGVRELLARVAALLRRSGQRAVVEGPEEEPVDFVFGRAKVFPKRMVLQSGKKEVGLSQRELKILEMFHRHPGEALSRDELLNAAWGVDYLGTTRTLDQHIAQLRKKVESHPGAPEFIQTVHGVGYKYCP